MRGARNTLKGRGRDGVKYHWPDALLDNPALMAEQEVDVEHFARPDGNRCHPKAHTSPWT